MKKKELWKKYNYAKINKSINNNVFVFFVYLSIYVFIYVLFWQTWHSIFDWLVLKSLFYRYRCNLHSSYGCYRRHRRRCGWSCTWSTYMQSSEWWIHNSLEYWLLNSYYYYECGFFVSACCITLWFNICLFNKISKMLIYIYI